MSGTAACIPPGKTLFAWYSSVEKDLTEANKENEFF
jgi:hypothetical protein